MMWNGDRRQSLRIFALKTQKKQQKENQNLNQGKKAGSTSTKDHQTNAAVMSSGNPLPERSKLQLLLGKLKRRDVHCMFSEPVNAEDRAKLNGGSYKALQEFEHDATLVWSNAMLFNDSSTLYYKEARSIRNLATKLFNSLKTDPESFVEISKSGCRGGRRSKYSEVDQRYTYRPLNRLLNENESITSTVYLSPQELVQNKQNSTGYTESLLQFVKDLGPTANTFACWKLQRYAEEAANVERVLTADQDTWGFHFMNALLGYGSSEWDTYSNLGGKPVRTMLDQDNGNSDSTRSLFGSSNSSAQGTSIQFSGKSVWGMPDQNSCCSFIDNPSFGNGYSFPSTWKRQVEADNLYSSAFDKGKNVQVANISSLEQKIPAAKGYGSSSSSSAAWLFQFMSGATQSPATRTSYSSNVEEAGQDWKRFRPTEAPPQPVSSRLFLPQSTSAGPSQWGDIGASTSNAKPIRL